MVSIKRHSAVLLMAVGVCAPACGEVEFAEFTVTQVSSETQLREAAGAAGTSGINGIAVQSDLNGFLYAIHVDETQRESVLRINPADGSAIKLTDSVDISTQLGTPYTQTLTLTSGFAYSPVAGQLYLGENFNGNLGEVSLIGIDVDTGAASLVARSLDLEGLNDHAVLPDGTILGVRGEDGNRTVGTVDPATGAWTTRLTQADLIAAAPGTTSLSPETVGVNPQTGDAYIFCHNDLELFRVSDVNSASPLITRLTQPELATVDLHDVAVDFGNNMFGFDEAGERIVIVRGTDGEVFSATLAEIGTQLGLASTFEPALWRGIAARSAGADRVDLFMVGAPAEHGIVRVRFGSGASSVDGWQLY